MESVSRTSLEAEGAPGGPRGTAFRPPRARLGLKPPLRATGDVGASVEVASIVRWAFDWFYFLIFSFTYASGLFPRIIQGKTKAPRKV